MPKRFAGTARSQDIIIVIMSTELLFRNDAYLQDRRRRVISVSERGIELDRTIFYPLGGGQVGDTGALVRANGERIAIVRYAQG